VLFDVIVTPKEEAQIRQAMRNRGEVEEKAINLIVYDQQNGTV
jgi:hypothetical protein